MPDASVLKYLSDGGVITLMFLVLIGGYRRWWCFGYQLDDAKRDRDEWKTLALRGMQTTDRAVAMAQQSAPEVR